MGATLKRDFHRASFNSLNVFVKYFDAMSRHPDMARAYSALPDVVKSGRTMTQMALDDLMDGFAFTMRRVPDDEIPASFFKQMMQLRDGRDVTDDEARHAMMEKITKLREDKSEAIKSPEFLLTFMESAPSDHRNSMVQNFRLVLSKIYQLTLDDQDFAALEDGSKYVQHYNTIAKNIMSTLNGNDDLFKESAERKSVSESADDEVDLDDDIGDETFEDLAQRVYNAGMPGPVFEVAKKGLRRLKMLNPAGGEYGSVFNQVDWLASIPWKKQRHHKIDIKKARAILDADHYGMDRVKDRILEFLAVQNQTKKTSPTILCIDGPPGTGKTSITKSIARATGRKYVRLALGGVNDEADIRGHRSTYIGAIPGRIIHAMKEAGVTNPLINLDEVDKLGQSMRGNPADALLEALDPEQNHTFRDHYLGVEYDLSDVMFVCTSNYLERIPPALRDRMDIIRISSYTREEKFEIAKQHLIPKQMGKNGLKDSQFSISDEALRKMIVSYTAEPGVRNLERVIARACRKAVMNIQEKKSSSTHITPDILEDVLGAGIIHRDAIPEEDTVGLINGLAYTQVGGCILPIQVTMRDAGQMQIKGTGLLGETMRESLNYVAEAVYKLAGPLGLDKKKLGKTMFHVHAPAAAIPKDGPSAGMAIATALISTLADIKIRRDVAMTGEIDVFGNILPIGGLKEKIEGAADAGARLVLIPHGNLSDLEQVPEAIRSRVEIRTVKRLEETLKLALTEEIKPAATTDNVIAFTSAASCDNDCGCTHNKPDTKKNATGGPAPG